MRSRPPASAAGHRPDLVCRDAGHLRNCCSAAAKIPLIGDGDTGYGNALNVQRTVIEYARAGAAAVMIEDQVSPKKCGHTRGKQVVSRAEARMKIRAAVEAAADADILVMARTDARAVHGFDEALARCRDFEAEGADIIFLEAPETEDEMRRFCGAMEKPCMANMVPGGKTPILPPAQLQEIGYKLALYPVMLLSSAIAAMQATLAALRPGSRCAASARHLLHRPAEVRGISRLLGPRDALSGEGLTAFTRSPRRGAGWRSSTTGACIRAQSFLSAAVLPHRVERSSCVSPGRAR